MSIINQMLKDIEQRRSSGFDGKGGILDDLAIGNSQAGRHWGMKLIILLLITTVVLLAWLLWDRFAQAPSQIKNVITQDSVIQTPVKEKIVKKTISNTTQATVKNIVHTESPENEITQNLLIEEKTVPSSEQVLEEESITDEVITPVKQSQQSPGNSPQSVEAQTASIERISPERIMATGKRALVRVYGEGFIPPLEVLLEWSDGRAFKVLDEWQIKLINEGEMHLRFNPGTQTDEWAMRVERRGGASSERFAFSVYAADTAVQETATPVQIIEQQKSSPSKIRRQAEPVEQAVNLFAKASGLLKSRQTGEAMKVLQRALSLDAQHTRARELLASLLFQDAQYIAAAEMLEVGRKQQPGFIPFSLLLARVRMQQGRDTDAIIVLESQKPPARDYSDYYALLAALYQRVARHDDAAKIYRGLVDIFPGRAVWWMGLGISMQSLNKSAEALAAYRRALKSQGLQPDLRKFVQQRIRLLAG